MKDSGLGHSPNEVKHRSLQIMSGRIVVGKRRETYFSKLYPDGGVIVGHRPPTWNLAPSALGWVIREVDCIPTMSVMRWGFGMKRRERGFAPYNARVETAEVKHPFRTAFRNERCIVPADGWYEWFGEEGSRQPYYFTRRDGDSVFFAGMWTEQSFCIFTTAADGELTRIHERKPLALDTDKANVWLIDGMDKEELIGEAVKADSFRFFPVNKGVSDSCYDGESLISPLP